MAARIKRTAGNVNWNSRASVGVFIAAVSVALAMLFTLGLGRDNFWDGVTAGFLTVAIFGASVYVSMKWAAVSERVSAKLSPSGFRAGLPLR